MDKRLFLAAITIAVIGAIGWQYLPGTARQDETGPPMVDVKVPVLDAGLRSGEAAFNENCVACHGVNAAGQQGVPAHHWRFGDMPPIAGITPDEVTQIVAYVRALQRANGIK